MIRILFFLISVVWITSAHAARLARVDVDRADLFDSPKSGANIVETVPIGTFISISNFPIEGFYKARSKSGKVGWISSETIYIYEKKEDQEKSPENRNYLNKTLKIPQTKDRPFVGDRNYFNLTSGLGFFNVKDVGEVTGFGDITNGIQFSFEYRYLLFQHWFIGLHADWITKGVAARDSATLEVFEIDFKSFPTMLGGGYHTRGERYAFSFGVFGGLALNTGLVSTAINASAPNETIYSANPITALAKVELDVFLTEKISLVISAGYRLLKTSELTPTESGSGANLFQNASSEFVPVSIDLSGLYAAGGIGITF